MEKNAHSANDFVVDKKADKINVTYHFFYGWDADGAPVEEYPTSNFVVTLKKNDSSK